MATADPCGWRAAVLGLRAVRGGALWVWGYSDTAAEPRTRRYASRGYELAPVTLSDESGLTRMSRAGGWEGAGTHSSGAAAYRPEAT